MRPIQPQRRKSSAGFWLGMLLVVLTGAGGVAAVAAFMGFNPFAAPAENTYVVRIPINGRPIPAYSKVVRDDLLNPQTGMLTFQELPPEAVVGMSITGVSSDQTPVDGTVDGVRNDNDTVVFISGDKEIPQSQATELGGALMNINAIMGRVVRKDKRAGRGFRESTFFPKGTPEGIAGATPVGMKAMTLDATKLSGIHGLNAGNRIDLLASVPMSEAASFQSASSGPLPSALLLDGSATPNSDAKETILLAQNALLLRPVTTRDETTTTSSLTSGQRLVNQPKYEVTIAFTPDDVIPLQTALDRGLMITCVATSMQPEESAAPVEQISSQLMAPVTVRPIPAYAVVTREAFINPATRRIEMRPVSERQVYEMQLNLSLEEMLGAVARHDIPAGSFVRKVNLLQSQRRRELQNVKPAPTTARDQDNFPRSDPLWQPVALPNTMQAQDGVGIRGNIVEPRPAVASFVPLGHTAIPVPWNRIYGSEHLQIEDHIDLLASYPLERQRSVRVTEQTGDGVITREYDEYEIRGTDRTRDESLANRGEPWFIATNAIVVGPVGFPPPNEALRAIGDTNSQSQTSGPAILLAIDNRDLESVSTVLNTPDLLLSVAFRGRDSQNVPDGFRHIAVAPVDMPAYSELNELHWKGLRRDITSRMVSVDDPRFADAITMDQITAYYGRILNVAKPRFAAFSAGDFLPAGATAGVVAAIGPDNALVSVAAGQIQGLSRYRNNDEVTLLLTGDVPVPANAVIHAATPLGPGSQVVVQFARVVQAASDISETVDLEVPRESAAALSIALFASDGGGPQLMAIARHRTDGPQPVLPDDHPRQPISGIEPLRSAPQVYEIIGGEARTHFFVNDQTGL